MIVPERLRVYFGTAAVFLGAGIVSLSQRLLSVGLPDLRGALGLGFDEASWIPTSFDMALMFMGPFTVYLGAMLGPRRVLLFAAPVYVLASVLVPLAGSYPAIVALQAIAGLGAGTFYPLSLSFALVNLPPKYTIYGIAAFSMEILATLSIGTHLEHLLVEYWSYRWIFWAGPVLTLALLGLVVVAMSNPPARPAPRVKPSFVGFLYASAGLALLLGVLEQGERLDWLSSPTIVAMLASGGFLLVAAGASRLRRPNPLVHPGFLLLRNTLILGFGLFWFRFVLLAILVLVPGYLGVVQGYRALETGRLLDVSVVPILVSGVVAVWLMDHLGGRGLATLGLALVAVSGIVNSRLTSAWIGRDFLLSQIAFAVGFTWVLVAQIGMIAQQVQETGAVTPTGVVRPVDVLTYAAFFQTVRLFGGQAGVTVVLRFLDVREQFHSNRLGYGVQAGDFLTEERLQGLAVGLFSASSGLEDARGRATVTLAGQVRRQAFTLAYADGFLLIVVSSVVFMLLLALMKPAKVHHDSPLAQVAH